MFSDDLLGFDPVFMVQGVFVDGLFDFFHCLSTITVNFTSSYDKNLDVDGGVEDFVVTNCIHGQCIVTFRQLDILGVHQCCCSFAQFSSHCLNLERSYSLKILLLFHCLLLDIQGWRVISNLEVEHHVFDEGVISLGRYS